MFKINFREKALRDLEAFRDINKVEEKQRDDKMYLTTYKLKVDLGLNEFLQKKCKSFTNDFDDWWSVNKKKKYFFNFKYVTIIAIIIKTT